MNEEAVEVTIAAVSSEDGPSAQEKADVARWDKILTEARKADKLFRQGVIRDRKLASGEALAGYEVKTNLIQATIDTLIPFLYAKDPDVDAVPQDQVPPPPRKRMQPPVPPQGAMDPLGNPIMAPDGVPVTAGPEDIALYEQQIMEYQQWQAEQQAQDEQDAERTDFNRRLSQTFEIVVSRLWHKAKLKLAAKPWLRASMTSSEGWLKATIQGDMLTDPTVQQQLYTMQEQAAGIEALQRQVAEGECTDYDAALAEIQDKITGLEGKVETYVARCLAIDWIDTLDMQAPCSLRSMSEYVSAPWLADATYYSADDASARYGIDKSKLASASRWKPPSQDQVMADDGQTVTNLASYGAEADSWTREPDGPKGYVRVWEIHAKCDNVVYTWIEGTDFWAKPPYPPRFPTTRFYPYFLLALYEVDGLRHPQSLAWRLGPLQEEYASARSNFAEVRRRAKQGVIADGTNVSPEDADKLRDSANQEITYIKPIRTGEPLSNSFAPKPYSSVDSGLYDTTVIRSDMETVSGAQDALRQGAVQPKTATQAEIEDKGQSARTGYSRDSLDDALNDFAFYTAELAIGAFTPEQVREWAGPYAVWPQGVESEKLQSMVHVAIRAGSSGKPNTSADRQAWAAIMPQMVPLITQIARLRGSDPNEIADKLKEVLAETVHRTGDSLDVDRFLPMPGANPAMQGAPMGAQPEATLPPVQ